MIPQKPLTASPVNSRNACLYKHGSGGAKTEAIHVLSRCHWRKPGVLDLARIWESNVWVGKWDDGIDNTVALPTKNTKTKMKSRTTI